LLAEASETYSPRQEAGLQLWIDAADAKTLFQDSAMSTAVSADGHPVGACLDKSGLARSPLQTVAVRRPVYKLSGIGGLPSIEFDGVDDWLTCTGWTIAQTDTVFVVCSRSVTGGTTLDGASVTGRQSISVNLSQWAFNAGSTDIKAGAWDANPHIHSVVFDGASSLQRLDGTQIAAGDASTNALEGIVVGANVNFNVRITGRIGEILVYGRRLSTTEIQRVEAYLKRKWRIA
jgi:hypothetical protein